MDLALQGIKPIKDKLYKGAIDSHVHSFGKGIKGVEDLAALQSEFGYTASNLLSCEAMDDAAQNALCIYYKLIAPNHYAYGGLHYRFPYSYAEETKKLMDIGLDGMKMVENKPTIRKKLNMASNDARYHDFYHYIEENKIPMIIHVADPEEFWNEEEIPSWAKEYGYYYGDGTFVTKEKIYEEVLDVLDQYPKLHATFAHFFFLSADLKRLSQWMDKYPYMNVDLVSGSEMYFNFTKDIEASKDFFIRYQDRIIFGTDNFNLYDSVDIENAIITNRYQHEFITTNHIIPAWDKTIHGLGLSKEIQEKIFRKNFLRLAGERPKPIHIPLAIDYLEERLKDNRYELSEEERAIISQVKIYCIEKMHRNPL